MSFKWVTTRKGGKEEGLSAESGDLVTMKRFLITAAIALAATAALAAERGGSSISSPAGEMQVAQGCGWYIFVGCSRSYEGALRHAGNGLAVLRTSDYRLLNPGWYCAAVGPYARRPATGEVRAIRRHVPDAYAKRAC